MENLNNTNVTNNADNGSVNAQMFYQPQPMYNPIQPSVPKTEKPKFKMSKKDFAFSVLFFVLSFLTVDFVMMHGFNLGATISFTALFVLTTAYLIKKDVKPSVFSLICGVLSLAGAVAFTLYNDTFIKAIMLFLVSALFTIYTCGISGTFRNRQGSFKMLCDMICGVFAAPFKNVGIIKNSYTGSFSKNKGILHSVIGILISLPVLLIVIPLLSSSDAAFSGLLELILKNIGIYFLEFVVAAIITPYVVFYMIAKRKNLKTGSENSAKFFSSRGIVPGSAAVSFLSVISLTYLVYLFSQLAYFFSAFSGFLPEGYEFTESAYARRGFFEMFAICVINIIIISLVNILIKKQKGVKSLTAAKFLSLFIMLFTVLLLVTAMAKMKLCLGIYGLSKNRLLVCVFMVMIVVIIFFYILHIFAPKISYMQPIIVFCSALFIALSFADIDGMIVKYNVEAYEGGQIEKLDMDYIGSLSDSAMLYIIELSQSEDKTVSEDAGYYVAKNIENSFYDDFRLAYDESNFADLEYDGAEDFRSYNIAKESARKAVAEYYNSLSADERNLLFAQYRFECDECYYDEEKNIYEGYNNKYRFVYEYNEQTGEYEFSKQEKEDISVGEEIL